MRRRLLRPLLVLAAAALLVAGCTDPAPGPGPDDGSTSRLPDVADPLPLEDMARFSGVAKMDAGSNCTGTLIDTGVPDAPAYVLTNGHCVGDIGRSPQQTTLAEDWFGYATFFQVAGNLGHTLQVPVVELAYSTMRHTDTGVVRLAATLAELEEQGVQAIPLATAEPDPGAAVVNVGVPVQDLTDDEWVLRKGECTLGQQHTILEWHWLWFDVWSNDCPGIIQGSSGSPLLELDAAGDPTQVVAVINTTSWGTSVADGGACFLNRPCQLLGSGPEMVEETSYAQSVAGIGDCFIDGLFALAAACPLPTSSLWTEVGGGAYRSGDLPNAIGETPSASFVAAQPGTMRTALVPLGDATSCAEPGTYFGAEEQPLPEVGEPWEIVGTRVPVPLPEEESWWTLCAVEGDDYDGAATVLYQVDRTPPLIEAGAIVEDIGDGALSILPVVAPPEIQSARFTWGAPDAVDCEDTDAFQAFFFVPLTILPEDLPAVYCVYGVDAAGNPTPIVEVPLG